MTKKISTSLLMLFFLTIIFPKVVFAADLKQAVIVNPIRGEDFWNQDFGILDIPQKQYDLIKNHGLSATWLVRYDALKNPNVVNFLKQLDEPSNSGVGFLPKGNKNQEVGLFLEITPTLTDDSGVVYNQSPNWHYAKSVLLTGYKVEDRVKMLDTAVKKYQEVFGVNPKSVGAWWIDAYSLGYLKEKYQIEVNLDVSDQFSTDQYQVWGQYYSVPFYPSKVNALMPAQSLEQKLGVVTLQWATRDPFNAYGYGAHESTYSVQANDYLLHNLGISYFEKLLDVYPQTTIGLENDFSWEKFGSEYSQQINLLAEKQKKSQIQVKNMRQFGEFYKSQNPKVSPNVLVTADDPLGSGGKVVWFMTPKYRLGLFYINQQVLIRDLRVLNGAGEEACLKIACEKLELSFSFSESIDDVNYKTHYLIDEGKISQFNAVQTSNGAKISYKNASGIVRTIEFLPNDIKIDQTIKTIPSVILDVTKNAPTGESDKIGTAADLSFNWFKELPKLSINFSKFLLLTIIFFFLPGWIISRRLILSVPTGIVIFTLLSYLLGFLKVDFLIWLFPILSSISTLKYGLPRIVIPKITQGFWLLTLLIVVGSSLWLTTTFRTGLQFNYGLGFWGPNGHDGIWHLSLIQALHNDVPPNNPVFAGENLTNYHYFFNLLVAKSANILGIDTLDLLFRFYPLLISAYSGILMCLVTQKLFSEVFKVTARISYVGSFFATFFLYFAGSFGFILTFFRDGILGGESAFWAQGARSTLLNPPFAISIVIFLSGLYIFYDLVQGNKWNWRKILLISILWGSLIEFKAYAGVLVLLSLGLLSLEKLILKRNLQYLMLLFGCSLITLLVFLPNNLTSSSLFVFQPLWLIYSMIVFTDRLGYERLSLAMQSGSLFKLIASYLLGFIIFIFGNMGSRIILLGGAKYLFKDRFLMYLTLFGTILPLLFIQTGTNWNIVQFFYYSLLVLSIFAGLGVAILWSKLNKIFRGVLVMIILIATLPANYSIVYEYLPNRPPAKISTNELEGLNFLKAQTEGVVMTLTYDESLKNKFLEPAPLYAYESTGYVSALSGHPSFLEDIVNLEILGVEYKGRVNEIRDFIRFPEKSQEILKRNNISYLYLVKPRNIGIDEGKMGLKKIFDNLELSIYQVL